MSLNRWQAKRQVVYLLGRMVWPDSPAGSVLASALVTTRRVEEFFNTRALPFAVVRSLDGDYERDQPALGEPMNLEVELVVQNVSDRYETGAGLGANRVSLGQSPGRGADEIVAEVQKAFLDADGVSPLTDSLKAIQCRVERVYEPRQLANAPPGVVKQRITVKVYNLVADRYYHPAVNFAGTAGSQSASLSWSSPPARFDLVGVKVLRKAGAVAPTTPIDGTLLAVGLSATSFVDAVGSSGQFTWGIFGIYDEWSATPANTQRWSAVGSVTLTV